MTVAYVIEFRVREGQRERFLRLITHVLMKMQHEQTYRDAVLHVDPDDPLHFLLHEIWDDHDDVMEVQLKREYRREWHLALPELLEDDRRISVWRPVAFPSGNVSLP